MDLPEVDCQSAIVPVLLEGVYRQTLMDLHQYGLKPLKITDRPVIDNILCSSESMLSAYSFAAHFIWRDSFNFYWGIMDDYLCLFAGYDGYVYMPVPPVPCHVRGLKDFQNTVRRVFSVMDKVNKDKAASRIENIDDAQKEAYVSMGYNIRSGEDEYVYNREDLVNLMGNQYKSMRASCNYFVRHYEYNYEPFQASFAGDGMRLYEEWKRERGIKVQDPFYRALLEDASFAHKQVLSHYGPLALTGRGVRVNDRLEGYTFGFGSRDSNIFYILLEITNHRIKGLAQFIFREFCREMDGYTYIITLGDSGLENLRNVKLSYRPCKIIHSSIACLP